MHACRSTLEDPTSKLALVSYSVGVNAGGYAASVRGAIPASHTISAAAWQNGATSRTITGVTKVANAVFTTSAAHGYAVGNVVWLSGISGSSAWATNLNNQWYTIGSVPSTTTFTLKNSAGNNVNTSSGYSGSYPGSGITRLCLVAACQVQVTSNGHGFANGANVFITGASGMTQINNTTGSGVGTTWPVANATSNTFVLSGTVGPNYGTYTANSGSAYCTTYGCQYYRFTNASGTTNVFIVSTCTTERTGANAYNDTGPASLLSLNYPSTATNGACPSNTVLPLTTNRATINSRISALAADGYTAGQIGAAWGWYTISPNFSGVFTGNSAPAAYGTPETLKVMVLMTDGAFNTNYCTGVMAQNAGGGNNVDQINCNATNGDPLVQAQSLCTNMKARGVVIYTVGFDMAGETQASRDMMAQCASDSAHAYMADNNAALVTAFQQIAQSISQLRISH